MDNRIKKLFEPEINSKKTNIDIFIEETSQKAPSLNWDQMKNKILILIRILELGIEKEFILFYSDIQFYFKNYIKLIVCKAYPRYLIDRGIRSYLKILCEYFIYEGDIVLNIFSGTNMKLGFYVFSELSMCQTKSFSNNKLPDSNESSYFFKIGSYFKKFVHNAIIQDSKKIAHTFNANSIDRDYSICEINCEHIENNCSYNEKLNVNCKLMFNHEIKMVRDIPISSFVIFYYNIKAIIANRNQNKMDRSQEIRGQVNSFLSEFQDLERNLYKNADCMLKTRTRNIKKIITNLKSLKSSAKLNNRIVAKLVNRFF